MAGFSLGLSSNLSEGDGEFAFIAAEIKTSCEGITQKKRGGSPLVVAAGLSI